MPGWPVQVDTQLLYAVADGPGTPPPSEEPRTALQFACTAADLYGNPITQGLELTSEPAQPQPPAGLVLTPTIAGAAVACAVEGKQDKTPVGSCPCAPTCRATCTPCWNRREISAGNASQLTCVAKDAYDNLVNDFPFPLDLAAAVSSRACTRPRPKWANTRCSACLQKLVWDLFTLHPALLDVQPGCPADHPGCAGQTGLQARRKGAFSLALCATRMTT